MKRPAGVPSQLSESMHKRLNSYALAASAAGVGVLALTTPADAKIIYTPAKLDCTFLCHLNLIEHKGHNSFFIEFGSSNTVSGGGNQALVVVPYSNAVVGRKTLRGYYSASALAAGVRVGPANQHRKGGQLMWGSEHSHSGNKTFRGPWANGGKGVKNRYLGLKFYISGVAHYGWARLSVKYQGQYPAFATTLTGYAYETIPNKPIIAGKTHGKNEATLGRLAQGASGVVSPEKK